MRPRQLFDDTRGASIAITHALTLAITAILISSLLVSTGGFLQSQQDRVAQSQLRDVGGDIASLIDRADRLNATGETVNATLDAEYPRTVGGEPYNLALVPSNADRTRGTLYLNASGLGLSVAIPVATDTPMAESYARGDDPTVRLCSNGSGGNNITLRRCP